MLHSLKKNNEISRAVPKNHLNAATKQKLSIVTKKQPVELGEKSGWRKSF